jgi:hypothetical protein
MDRVVWEVHLAQAKEAIAKGERHIARQKQLIAELERDGHDSQTARELLAQFESVQALHIEHGDRLCRELAAPQRPLSV